MSLWQNLLNLDLYAVLGVERHATTIEILTATSIFLESMLQQPPPIPPAQWPHQDIRPNCPKLPNQPSQPTPVQRNVYVHYSVTLEEIFRGDTKQCVYQRWVNSAGTSQLVDGTVSFHLKPSMHSGTIIKFCGLGNEIDGATGDLVLVFKQYQHPSYGRVGDDLVVMCFLPLTVPLLGGAAEVKGIDGKRIRVWIAEPFPPIPPLVKRIEGEGMPTANGGRGALVIHFYVQFPHVPSHLRDETDKLLARIQNAPSEDGNN
uniref:Chaperone DnaJ C-terminal domain-containing protein n=1 Tax=Anopheles epiroticus TaxID=199890 RepID=A0A182PDJ0_9DIPT